MSDRVALAFESGGDPALCGEALSVLGAAGKRATIFLDGMWAERNPVTVRRAADDGHELGNHAYSHPDLRSLDDDEVAAELEHTEAVALRLTGRSTRPWLRPPYQQVDDRVRAVAGRLGFRCLCRDALDGAHHIGPSTAEAIMQRSLDRAIDGEVLTYHLSNRHMIAVLPEIIAHLGDRGARLGPVSDLSSPPPEQAPVHQDFAHLRVDPGYLRMHQSSSPLQMINLLGLGADRLAIVDRPIDIGQAGGARVCLIVFGGHTALEVEATAHARQMICLAGEAAVEAHNLAELVCTAYVQTGDILGLPGQWRARLLPTPPLRHRAVILVMG